MKENIERAAFLLGLKRFHFTAVETKIYRGHKVHKIYACIYSGKFSAWHIRKCLERYLGHAWYVMTAGIFTVPDEYVLWDGEAITNISDMNIGEIIKLVKHS